MVEVSYNVETAVDSKHKLVVGTHTINRNDRNALSPIALEAKLNLQADEMTILADKGFYNSWHFQTCIDNNTTTIVAAPEMVNSNETGTTKEYMVDKFIYNHESDTYTCPAGQSLYTNGNFYSKTKTDRSLTYQYKKYHTAAGRNVKRKLVNSFLLTESFKRHSARYQRRPPLGRMLSRS